MTSGTGSAPPRCDVRGAGRDVTPHLGRRARACSSAADLPTPVRAAALDVVRPAGARRGRRAPRRPADEVHFHEVGALDAIADVVGACAGLHASASTGWRPAPVALGAGTVPAARTASCRCPAPPCSRCCRGGCAGARRRRAVRDVHADRRRAAGRARSTSWGPLPAMRVTRSAPAPAAATSPSCRTCCGSCSASPPAGAGAPVDAARAGDQRRRPGPAAVAGRARSAARRRRLRRLADADPDEEGPAGAHAARARARRRPSTRSARRSSPRPRRSACASRGSASTALDRADGRRSRSAAQPVRVKPRRLGGRVVNVSAGVRRRAPARPTRSACPVKEVLRGRHRRRATRTG